MVIKPRKLKEGDYVGVVAPCSPIGSKTNKRFLYCLKAIEKLGLRYKVGKFANKENDYMAGTPKERADDINRFFADPEIKAIWCLKGGISGQLSLKYLDYKLIRNNPKIFIGYSDVVNYNLALYTKSNLVNFYGPALTTFSDQMRKEKDKYYLDWTIKEVKKMLFESKPYGKVPTSKKYILYGKKHENNGPKVINPGKAEGILLGGHFYVFFITMFGTQYFPKIPKNTILFLEGGFGDPPVMEAYLWRLEEMGGFKNIKGILVGRDHFSGKECKTTSFEILKKFGKKYNVPIITNLDFGHTDPMIPIPLGIKAKIDTSKKSFFIEESAVK
jgi:muramoyltetrapeptide carboxypeptidase